MKYSAPTTTVSLTNSKSSAGPVAPVDFEPLAFALHPPPHGAGGHAGAGAQAGWHPQPPPPPLPGKRNPAVAETNTATPKIESLCILYFPERKEKMFAKN